MLKVIFEFIRLCHRVWLCDKVVLTCARSDKVLGKIRAAIKKYLETNCVVHLQPFKLTRYWVERKFSRNTKKALSFTNALPLSSYLHDTSKTMKAEDLSFFLSSGLT